jgi:hypothetical protein
MNSNIKNITEKDKLKTIGFSSDKKQRQCRRSDKKEDNKKKIK